MPGDAEAISALTDALARRWIWPDCDARGRDALSGAMSVAATRGRLTSTGYAYLVAEKDGQVIGVAGMRLPHHLYHLFVDDASQRRGLARRLWQELRHHPHLQSWPGAVTVNASRGAVGFYHKLGFVRAGDEENRGGIRSFPMRWYAVDA